MKKSVFFTFVTFLFIFLLIPTGCRESEPPRIAWTKAKTFAGLSEKFGEPFGPAFDKNGALFVSDGEQGKIWRVLQDGSIRLFTDKLHTPSQIAFDKNGDLIVADSGTHTIKKIKPGGEIELIAGVENQSGYADGEAAQSLFNAPVGIAVFEEKIFVADTYNDRIRVIESGKVSTLAGSEQGFADGLGDQARFDTPNGLAVWRGGKILAADTANKRIRVIEPDGKVWTLTGGEQEFRDGLLFDAGLTQPAAISVDKSGSIFIADGNAVRVIRTAIFPFVETVSGDRRGFADGSLKSSQFNRPSGLAFDEAGNLFVADSENQVIRILTGADTGKEITDEEVKNLRYTAEEFKKLAEPRWTYEPPERAREIAGTLGEIRGEITEEEKPVWFHNGLDIAGGYGETARFIRPEKVLRPTAAENFATSRELLRMPTIGYIHIRLGRDAKDKVFEDNRFQFSFDSEQKLKGLRVPRGAKFEAGEAVGTLNAMNHVHLIAGKSGAEMNALAALDFPNISDARTPTIEKVSLFDENWNEIETQTPESRINLSGKTRIVVRAFDQMDGNAERRRLGVYKIGYQVLTVENPLFEPRWTIQFDRLPDAEAVRFVYAKGSKSGATGETIFNYIASNEVNGDGFEESFFDASQLDAGNYILRVFAADLFDNTASKDISFQAVK